MKTFIADAPNGEQLIFTVEDSGGYFEPKRVIWDTSVNGVLPPSIVVGGMIRSGNSLVFSQERKNQHDEAYKNRIAQNKPTKEQLMAELAALTAKIQALE